MKGGCAGACKGCLKGIFGSLITILVSDFTYLISFLRAPRKAINFLPACFADGEQMFSARLPY